MEDEALLIHNVTPSDIANPADLLKKLQIQNLEKKLPFAIIRPMSTEPIPYKLKELTHIKKQLLDMEAVHLPAPSIITGELYRWKTTGHSKMSFPVYAYKNQNHVNVSSDLSSMSDLGKLYVNGSLTNVPYASNCEMDIFEDAPTITSTIDVLNLEECLLRKHCPFISNDGKNKHLDQINGVSTPYVYVCNKYTFFGFHLEDDNNVSLNLALDGSKIWLFVPLDEVPRLFDLLKKIATEIDKEKDKSSRKNKDKVKCMGIHFHKMFVLTENFLMENGFTVLKYRQKMGEIIMTFPYGAHCGYNDEASLNIAMSYADVIYLLTMVAPLPPCICENKPVFRTTIRTLLEKYHPNHVVKYDRNVAALSTLTNFTQYDFEWRMDMAELFVKSYIADEAKKVIRMSITDVNRAYIKCDNCDQTSFGNNSQYMINRHAKEHENPNGFECKECGFKLKTASTLSTHLNRKHNKAKRARLSASESLE